MRKPKVNLILRWVKADLWGNSKFSKPIGNLLRKYIVPEQRS